jgi:hypothetical protein
MGSDDHPTQFFVSGDSKGVLCFDTDLEVVILKELANPH